ncbi:hypothetical protein ACFX2I_040321 [Malus domestica]
MPLLGRMRTHRCLQRHVTAYKDKDTLLSGRTSRCEDTCLLCGCTALGTALPLMHIAFTTSSPPGLSAPHCSYRLLVCGRHRCIEDIGRHAQAAPLQRL